MAEWGRSRVRPNLLMSAVVALVLWGGTAYYIFFTPIYTCPPRPAASLPAAHCRTRRSSLTATAAAQLGRGHGESQDPHPRARRRRRLARHASGRDHLLSQRTDAHACVVPSKAERP